MKKSSLPFLWTFCFLAIALLLSIAIGSVFISPLEVWRALSGQTSNQTAQTILWSIRLPRTGACE